MAEVRFIEHGIQISTSLGPVIVSMYDIPEINASFLCAPLISKILPETAELLNRLLQGELEVAEFLDRAVFSGNPKKWLERAHADFHGTLAHLRRIQASGEYIRRAVHEAKQRGFAVISDKLLILGTLNFFIVGHRYVGSISRWAITLGRVRRLLKKQIFEIDRFLRDEVARKNLSAAADHFEIAKELLTEITWEVLNSGK